MFEKKDVWGFTQAYYDLVVLIVAAYAGYELLYFEYFYYFIRKVGLQAKALTCMHFSACPEEKQLVLVYEFVNIEYWWMMDKNVLQDPPKSYLILLG